MNPDEVVVHVVDRQRCSVILNLFRVGISQPGKPSIVHSDGEVLALNVAGADVLRVRPSLDRFLFAADALRRAVALLAFGVVHVNLDEHSVVDIVAKGVLDGAQVRLRAVTGQLHAIGKASRKVFHKIAGGDRIALADHETGDQLGISVNGDPRPHVAANALFELLNVRFTKQGRTDE